MQCRVSMRPIHDDEGGLMWLRVMMQIISLETPDEFPGALRDP